MSDEELQRRRAARLREQIERLEREAAAPETPATPPNDQVEECESRRKAASSPSISPREFIHRRMQELDAEEKA